MPPRELAVSDLPPFFYLRNAATKHVVGVDGWRMDPCPVHLSALLKTQLAKAQKSKLNYPGEDAFVWYAVERGKGRGIGIVNRKSGLWLRARNHIDPSGTTLGQDATYLDDPEYGWRFQDLGTGVCSIGPHFTPADRGLQGTLLSQDGSHPEHYPSGNLNLRVPKKPADPFFAWELTQLGALVGPREYTLSLKQRNKVAGGDERAMDLASKVIKLVGDTVKATGKAVKDLDPVEAAAAVMYGVAAGLELAAGIESLTEYFSDEEDSDIELLYKEMMPVLTSVERKLDELKTQQPLDQAKALAATARSDLEEAAAIVSSSLTDIKAASKSPATTDPDVTTTSAHVCRMVGKNDDLEEALKSARRNYNLALGILWTTEGAFVPWVQLAIESIAYETLRLTIHGDRARAAHAHAQRIYHQAVRFRDDMINERMAKIQNGKDLAYGKPNEYWAPSVPLYTDHVSAVVTKTLGGQRLASLLKMCSALVDKAEEIQPAAPAEHAHAH